MHRSVRRRHRRRQAPPPSMLPHILRRGRSIYIRSEVQFRHEMHVGQSEELTEVQFTEYKVYVSGV